MRHSSSRSSSVSISRRRGFSFALLGCACAALPLRQGHAQTTNAAAVPTSSGVNIFETSGVYKNTANGANHYVDAGAGSSFPSFAVLDFSAGSFGLSAGVASVSNLTLTVTEANFASSKAGGFGVYLTETTTAINETNSPAATFTYQTAGAPSGLGTQFGTSGTTLFQIGTFTSNASTTSTQTDVYTLTLSAAAQSYFTQQLNAGSTSDIRLVIASSDSTGYVTLDGNSGGVTTAQEPTLGFTATLNVPTLSWTPGGSSNGGSGTWLPAGTAGDTSWNGGPWNSSDLAIFSGTAGGAVTIGTGGVSAIGIQFNNGGYTLGVTGGPAITLTSSGTVQVTNSGDTDTINAPVAGGVGLNKTGAGTLVLGGANTYTGVTTVSAGTLQVSADTALGDPTATVTLAGGTLQSGLTANGSTLTLARAISGSGSLGINAGTTLAISGVVNAGTITLPGAGTFMLTNTGNTLTNGASNAFTGLTFQTAGASLQAPNANQSPAFGTVNIGTGGITASQASGGNVTASAIFQPTGATVPLAVTNAGATLTINGLFANGGSSVATTFVKTGAGTVILNSDNSAVAGAGTGAPSFRQGSVGSANGGVVSIGAANPNPGSALGTGEYQANGGTISNDTGSALTLAISDISLGAQNATATPGGLVFAGANAITVTGPISLYKGATTAYQHAITVNTPTTFSGIFTASANTTTSTGVTILGSSTLTLNGTAPNTFFEPVTIATSGAGAGVIAGKDGAFGANTGITLNTGAQLTINTGVTTGTVNAINNAALITINGTAGTPSSFGKIVLTIGSATETVGGLYLSASDGKFAAGYLPAGVYGSTSSGAPAQNQDNNLFSGTGLIMNLGTAVPEPSTWAAILAGLAGLGLVMARRRV